MERVHLGVVERRQDVAVDDEHRLRGTFEQRQAAGGPQRRRLAAVVDPRAELAAVAAEGLDQLGQVAGDDRDVAEAEPRELAEDDLDDRHRVVVAQRHQRLGQARGCTAAAAFPCRPPGVTACMVASFLNRRRPSIRSNARCCSAAIASTDRRAAPSTDFGAPTCPNAGRAALLAAAASSKTAISSRSTCTSNVCSTAEPAGPRPTSRAAPRSSAMCPSAAISSPSASGERQDVPLAAVGHQLAGPVLLGGDHRQAAGQGLEDDERAGVVVRRLDEEVARPVAVADVGIEAEEVDRVRQPQPARQPDVRSGVAAAADEQVDRPARRIPAMPRSERLEERLAGP